jgi:hypothetical protein
VLKLDYIPYTLACHLQIDAEPVSGPAYHFGADLYPDPDFYLMRMRIHVTKIMWIHSDPVSDPQHYVQGHTVFIDPSPRGTASEACLLLTAD